MSVTNYTFAFLFVVLRVLLYGWGLYDFFRTAPLITTAPRHLVNVVLALVTGGYALNLWWAKQIVEKVGTVTSTTLGIGSTMPTK